MSLLVCGAHCSLVIKSEDREITLADRIDFSAEPNTQVLESGHRFPIHGWRGEFSAPCTDEALAVVKLVQDVYMGRHDSELIVNVYHGEHMLEQYVYSGFRLTRAIVERGRITFSFAASSRDITLPSEVH